MWGELHKSALCKKKSLHVRRVERGEHGDGIVLENIVRREEEGGCCDVRREKEGGHDSIEKI